MINKESYNSKFYAPNIQDEIIKIENDYIINYYKKINYKDKKCCDYGCGTGYWTNELFNLGANICGYDISNDLILYCHNKYPMINFYVLPNHLEKFDLIFINWVFQEILDMDSLIATMSTLQSLSNNEAKLYVVDNIYPDSSKANKILTDCYGEIFQYRDGKKLRFFPNNRLVKLFYDFGYTILKTENFGESFLSVFSK